LHVQRRREEYLAFVAHDLRTPLNALGLAARVLEMECGQARNPRADQMLHTLHRNVRHLEALVERVLKENDHVRTEGGVKLERRQFDLWPLVERLIHDLHPVAGTSSTKLVNAVPEDLMVYADSSLLTRIFQNLIANAIKSTPRGQVVIGARGNGPGGAAEFWVSDNGSGIPREKLAAIVEQLDGDSDSSGEAGLGLAIVKTFVRAHGGKITVDSQEGGSTFRFSISGDERE
jgi:signal transduction histidine kinase